MFKRKRKEEVEQERIRVEKDLLEKFQKSRKVGRSPPLKRGNRRKRNEHGETG